MKKRFPLWVPVLGVSVVLAALAIMSLPPNSRIPSGQYGIKTQMTITSLQQAVERFESEYPKPLECGANDFTTNDDAGRTLLTVLLGKEETGINMQNPRQIPFLSVAVSSGGKKRGLVYRTGTSGLVEGLFDSWGNPFRVILDTDKDGVIYFDYGGKPQEVRGKHALVSSKGMDGIEGTKDDQRSWNPER